MAGDDARQLIATIRSEIEQAADMFLSAAEMGLRDIAAARDGQAAALERIEQTLCAIMEACAFQDITGQRLSQLVGLIEATAPEDPLLNGPAALGGGLDQDAAAALFDQLGGAVPAGGVQT